MRGNAQRMWNIYEYDAEYTKLENELEELKILHRCRGDVIKGQGLDMQETLKENEMLKIRQAKEDSLDWDFKLGSNDCSLPRIMGVLEKGGYKVVYATADFIYYKEKAN